MKQNNQPSALIITTSIISLILLIVMIVIAVIIKVDLDKTNFDFTNIIGNNWKDSPISRIVVSTGSTCPAGSTPAIQNSKFPGFKGGCHCASHNNYYETLCTQEQLNAGCKSFNESAPKAINDFDGLLCSYRQKNDYLELNKTASNETCSNSTHTCGTIDTVGNKLCVNDTNDCPINYLRVVDANFNTSTIPFSVDSVKLDDNRRLLTSNKNINGTIIDELSIMDHTPCADSTENKIMLNKTTYTCQKNISGHFNSNQYQLLDTIKLSKLVDENGLKNQMEAYPFYSSLKNRDVSLYANSFIGLNNTCAAVGDSLFKPEDIPNLFVDFKSDLELAAIDYISFVAIFIYCLCFIAIVIRLILTCSNSKSNSLKVYLNTGVAFLVILLLIIGIVSTIVISNYRNYYIWIINDPNCTDAVNQQLFNNFDSNVKACYNLGVIYTLIALVMFFLVLAEYLVRHCSDDTSDDDDLENNYNEKIAEENKNDDDNKLLTNNNNNTNIEMSKK